MAIDLASLTVDAIHEGFADGAFNAEELTRVCLAHIERVNPNLNAIIFLNDDAIEEAREIDRRRKAGEMLGSLAGVPFVAKDTMNVAGFPTTGGWRLLCSRTGGVDLMPDRDCAVVARMRAAGAILLGKTNVPVLSATGTHADDSWAGPTINAVDAALVPGGSSAGSGCAVASGMVVLGLAEETGGSIQNPAAVHGLVGVKPTFGLVSNAGVLPLGASTLDVMGPIARTVRDAALALDVLAGYSSDDPKTIAGVGTRPAGGYAATLAQHPLSGKRLGLFGPGWRRYDGTWRARPLSPVVDVAYANAQGALVRIGADLVADPFSGSGFAEIAQIAEGGDEYAPRGMECLPHDLEKFLKTMRPDVPIRTFAQFSDATKSEDPFAPDGVLNYLAGIPEFEQCRANPSEPPPSTSFYAAREAYLAIFNRVMDDHALDALVFPQMADPVPRRGAGVGIRETTVAEINIAGLPAVTVPAGRLPTGEPFSLIFVGRLWSEALLLGLAHDFEKHAAAQGLPR